MITIEDIRFDDAGFQLDGDTPGSDARYWTSTEGDQVGLYLFALRPDIGADPADLTALRAQYRLTASRNGLGVLEIETFDLSGVLCVRTLLKAAQAPAGRIYVGAITVPFRDFSFVFRVQCNEGGVAGVRDKTVMDLLIQRGDVTLDPSNGSLTNWLSDPYDSAASGTMIRNRADLDVYDAMFPAHALSRARRMLDHLQRSIRLSQALRDEPPFEFSRL